VNPQENDSPDWALFNPAAPSARPFLPELASSAACLGLIPFGNLCRSDSETSRHYRASVPQAFLPASVAYICNQGVWSGG
jgi:hypothetical protein